jgi:hypothetical protein
MHAANSGHHEIVQLLLASKADVNAVNEAEGTALMQAAFGYHQPVVEVLLDGGAVPKLGTLYRGTAMEIATKKSDHDPECQRIVQPLKHQVYAGRDIASGNTLPPLLPPGFSRKSSVKLKFSVLAVPP